MYVIQIVYVCCNRLLDIAGRACRDDRHKCLLFHISSRLAAISTPTDTHNSASDTSMKASSAVSQYFAATDSLKLPTLSTRNMTKSLAQIVNVRPSISCESFLPVPQHVHGRLSPLPPLTPSASSLSPVSMRQSWAPTSHSDDCMSLPGMLTTAGRHGASPAERVAFSMSCTSYPPEVLAKVDGYKQKLNTSSVEWKKLSVEDDPHVLSALMWDWIDELKVLSAVTVWFTC